MAPETPAAISSAGRQVGLVLGHVEHEGRRLDLAEPVAQIEPAQLRQAGEQCGELVLLDGTLLRTRHRPLHKPLAGSNGT
ncbi:hypothetical protein AB0B45_50435 [Nonomuraea sp. NPDC049152]|uniref:hypothetical protein n=1 Tax=Nonomuraea sp. NPDC049152 TaxID=3154350 RepID=UPI0033C657A0